MRKSRINKEPEPTKDVLDQRSQPGLQLVAADPDMLRDSVQRGLSQLSEEERSHVLARVLTVLSKTGVNLGQLLLVLGIPARTAGELTAPEVASLVRYVRFNEPMAMAALAPVLSEIVTTNAGALVALKVSRRAA